MDGECASHSFNRNFKGRNDASPKTYAFLASPEIVMAMAIKGDLNFNPIEGSFRTAKGTNYKLAAPQGEELPKAGFVASSDGVVYPDFKKIELKLPRLQIGGFCYR